jgi:tRNA(fMet)-specific endonuclease VapC
MKYLLDTNICSYIIKYKPLEVWKKFKSLPIEDCAISSITLAELKYWVARNKRLHEKSKNHGTPNINEQIIDNFVSHLDVVEFDTEAAIVYGKVRDALEAKGITVGSADLFIGSHAISLRAVLVTNNVKDFKAFPDIQLENWAKKS